MIHSGSWRKGRRNFSLIWTCTMIAVVVAATTTTVVDSLEALHPNSNECDNRKITLLCNKLDSTKKYRLENFAWGNIKTVIIENATHLILEEPLCINQTMEVKVFNSDRVTTQSGPTNCSQQLFLSNSKDVTIEDGINFINMSSSEARKIILPLGSFSFTDSQIEEASLIADTDTSTMTNSTIQVVKELVIKGSMLLAVKDTSLATVERFTYDSSQKSSLNNVAVDSVAHNGFIVQRGELTLENTTIKNVASVGLVVVHGGALILQDCEIKNIVYDSIIVTKGGSISFQNVTIGQHRDISFTFSEVFGVMYPLAFMGHSSISLAGWVAIAVFMGIAVGAVMGSVLMIVLQRRLNKVWCFKTDTTEDMQDTTSQSALNLNTYKHEGQFNPTVVPSRSKRRKPDKGQQVGSQQGVPIELAPNAPMTQRPPLPVPHEGSSSTVTTQNLSKPNKKKMDERDVLPLPPPPPMLPTDHEEELYDDVQVSTTPGGNVFPLNAKVTKYPAFGPGKP